MKSSLNFSDFWSAITFERTCKITVEAELWWCWVLETWLYVQYSCTRTGEIPELLPRWWWISINANSKYSFQHLESVLKVDGFRRSGVRVSPPLVIYDPAEQVNHNSPSNCNLTQYLLLVSAIFLQHISRPGWETMCSIFHYAFQLVTNFVWCLEPVVPGLMRFVGQKKQSNKLKEASKLCTAEGKCRVRW